MKNIIRISLCVLLPVLAYSQSYTDYIGGGHVAGMQITASHTVSGTSPANTFNGEGMESRYFEASRFLSHATMGYDKEMIDELMSSDLDFDGWIDSQYAIEDTSYLSPILDGIWDEIMQYHLDTGGIEEDLFGPYHVHFNYAYWQNHMTNNQDLLRHKIANALSQILVVSRNSDIGDWGEAMSGYYDILLKHAFGNYKDLLVDVTKSIQMGYYLSHFNNAKEDLEAMTSPDENYAREIMQLFTIGLYELNLDGTRVLDSNGNPIPTYDQVDIQEFAQVFTGMGIGVLEDPTSWPYTPFFGLDMWAAKKDAPMIMYQDFHDTSTKELLNGAVLPANQPGMTDINMAIDNLFNHNNTPPFISKLLIKRFVKSNPTPEYVARVASVFVDNGSGVRGDLKAVIKAILLDEEARSGTSMLAPHAGRAKEPLQKMTSFMKMADLDSPNGKYWETGWGFREATGQNILASPTVFNFYLPDFQPIGPIADADLTAPEFKLHNTSTSISSVNTFWYWAGYWGGEVIYSWNYDIAMPVTVDHTQFLQYAEQPELLINEIDRMFTNGQLSDQTRAIIRETLHNTYWTWNDDWREERVKSAIYYVLMSPDYNVMK